MSESGKTKIITPPQLSARIILSGLRGLVDYSDLMYTLSLHRIKVRYKQSVLGVAWAVVQPLAMMAIYTVIFSVFTRVPTGNIPYPVFVFTALLPWTFFSTALTNTSTSLVSHSQLITKVYFPREILPITYIVAALFDFLIAGCILAIMMVWYGMSFPVTALYAIPIMVATTAFAMVFGLLLSAIQVRIRDIGLALPLILQVWMFASPVVYPLSEVPERYRSLYELNPLVGFIHNFRRVVLEGQPPEIPSLLRATAITLILLPIVYVYFKHREATMADSI